MKVLGYTDSIDVCASPTLPPSQLSLWTTAVQDMTPTQVALARVALLCRRTRVVLQHSSTADPLAGLVTAASALFADDCLPTTATTLLQAVPLLCDVLSAVQAPTVLAVQEPAVAAPVLEQLTALCTAAEDASARLRACHSALMVHVRTATATGTRTATATAAGRVDAALIAERDAALAAAACASEVFSTALHAADIEGATKTAQQRLTPEAEYAAFYANKQRPPKAGQTFTLLLCAVCTANPYPLTRSTDYDSDGGAISKFHYDYGAHGTAKALCSGFDAHFVAINTIEGWQAATNVADADFHEFVVGVEDQVLPFAQVLVTLK